MNYGAMRVNIVDNKIQSSESLPKIYFDIFVWKMF